MTTPPGSAKSGGSPENQMNPKKGADAPGRNQSGSDTASQESGGGKGELDSRVLDYNGKVMGIWYTQKEMKKIIFLKFYFSPLVYL